MHDLAEGAVLAGSFLRAGFFEEVPDVLASVADGVLVGGEAEIVLGGSIGSGFQQCADDGGGAAGFYSAMEVGAVFHPFDAEIRVGAVGEE